MSARPSVLGTSARNFEDEQVLLVLQSAREHLEMELSWVTRISGGQQIIEHLDGDAGGFRVALGDATDFETSYCHSVLGGRRAGVVPDARNDPRTARLPGTAAMGIGSYVGAPLTLADGQLYGMLCCFSARANPSLQQRDADFLQVLAVLLSNIVARQDQRHRHTANVRGRVLDVLERGGPDIVFQGVHDLRTNAVVGFEALSRFPAGFGGPDRWFADAARVGLGADLEFAAINNALECLDQLPNDIMLGVNASPEVIMDGRLFELLSMSAASKVLVEITEHVRISDYRALRSSIDRIRDLGTMVVSDDTGAGFAGLQHLVELAPDAIKIDISITRGVDVDPARVAVATALAGFATTTGAHLVAEGIETGAELDTFVELGVRYGQGYHLSRPAPFAQALEWVAGRPEDPELAASLRLPLGRLRAAG